MITTFTITGNLTKDIVVELVGENKVPKAVFVVASNRSQGASADFVVVTAWGDTALNLAKYKGKGDYVAIEARIRPHEWTNADGELRKRLEVHAERIDYGPRVNRYEDDSTE